MFGILFTKKIIVDLENLDKKWRLEVLQKILCRFCEDCGGIKSIKVSQASRCSCVL